MPTAFFPALLLFSRLSASVATETNFLIYVFSYCRPRLSRFLHRIYNSCGTSYAYTPLPPSPIVSLASRPQALVLSMMRPPSLFPSPSPVQSPCQSLFASCLRPLVSNSVPVPVPSHPAPSHQVPAPVPFSILRSFARLHPYSRVRSVTVPITVHVLVPEPGPIFVSFPVPDSDILRTALSGARKRHSLSAGMMTRAE